MNNENSLLSFLELESYQRTLECMKYNPNINLNIDKPKALITINDKLIKNCNINIFISRKYKYDDVSIYSQKVLEKYTHVVHVIETGDNNIINIMLSKDNKNYIYLDNFKYYESED